MAVYGGSEELLANLGQRQGLPDQSQYLNQINRGTDQAVGLLENAGNQMAENNRNYWQNLQRGVESGLNEYDRAQQRQLENQRFQSEEARANRSMNLQEKAGEREQQRFDVEKPGIEAETANKVAQNKAMSAVGPSGMTGYEFQAKEPQLQNEREEKRLAIESTSAANAAKLANLEINKTQLDMATDKAVNALHNAVFTGDQKEANQVIERLRSEGVPEQAIQTALTNQNTAAQQARVNGNLQKQLDPTYQGAKQAADLLRADTGTVLKLQQLRTAFDKGRIAGKWLGYVPNGMNDEAAKDAASQFADFLVQVGQPEVAQKVRNGYTDKQTLDLMDQYISAKTAAVKQSVVNNQDKFAQYKNDPNIAYPVGLAKVFDTPDFQKELLRLQGVGKNGNPLAPLTNTGAQPETSSALNQALTASGMMPQPAIQPIQYTPPGGGMMAPSQPSNQGGQPSNQTGGIIPASQQQVPSLRHLSRGTP